MNQHLQTRPSLLDSIRYLWRQIRPQGNLWDGARLLHADVPLDAGAAQNLMPLGLRVSEPARGTVFIADYPQTSFTIPYREAALLIHVRHWLFGEGLHCPWMIVDDDTALIYGRELLGYPKKMGEFAWEESGERIHASITRRGIKVIEMDAELGPVQSTPTPLFDVKTFNAAGPGSAAAILPLLMFRPMECISEARDAQVTLRLQASEFDPLTTVIDGDPLAGRLTVMDILRARYMLWAGVCGPKYFTRLHAWRYR